MNKLSLFLFFLLILSCKAEEQKEISAKQNASANLIIRGKTIRLEKNTKSLNLKSLEKVKKCNRIVIWKNSLLHDLSGLEYLTEINGHLIIDTNQSLEDINALKNIKTILGDIRIFHNPKLKNLSGLSNITKVSGEVFIHSNGTLDAPSVSIVNILTDLNKN